MVRHAWWDRITSHIWQPWTFNRSSRYFCGQVIEADDAGYDDARKIWNAIIDRRPKVIARCSGIADVVDAVNFGRTNSLLTAIRGGGHNVGGRALCDDGLVVDLSRMRAVHANSANSTVRVQGGATLAIWTAKRTSSALQSRPA